VLDSVWPLVRPLVDDALAIPLDEVAAAIKTLAERVRVIAEGAGAAAVSAGTPDHVRPRDRDLSGGSVQTTYALPDGERPDGERIVSTTPPRNFSPLRATRGQLAKYGFPLPPSSRSAYAAWHAAMAAYKSDTPPAGTLAYVPRKGKGAGSPKLAYSP
jgi:hypothetical protein